MAKKKKISGLSISIVALNIVIVGIIILLIVLIYLHIKDDTGNKRGETTTTPEVTQQTDAQTDAQTESNVTETPQQTGAETEVTVTNAETEAQTNSETPVVSAYDRAFFQNDLFIGDSISTGLYLYDFLDKNNVFAEVGLNPETASTHPIDGVTSIEKAQAMNPKHIYIMLGSNGLAFLDPDYMATKMTELIEKLEMACPTAKICVISISPVTKAHDAQGNETMAKVNAYNTALKSVCDQGGYTYIDICSQLLDSEGYFAEKYAEEDGLHFKGNTYKLLLSTVQKAVQ